MPQPKEKAAMYVRESRVELFESNTIESQANAVRLYCDKEDYSLSLEHEYIEAISGYTVVYTERERLMDMLAAAKRREFSVLVVSEIRALSRRGQAEIFILYDFLKKYGVRLETISEKFEDSAMGRFMLSVRAMVAEVERENTYSRTTRGRIDRLKGGAMNGHPRPAYGYKFVDTAREQKALYEFDHTIIFVDEDGTEWSPYLVCLEIFKLLRARMSLAAVCERLNDLGIPIPHGNGLRKGKALSGLWQPATIHVIATNPVYIGEVYNNRYYKEGKTSKLRPRSQWHRLPDCPALIDQETFLFIQKQFDANKEDALRNNKHPQDLGLVRGKFIRCGICGRSMHVAHSGPALVKNGTSPVYRCRQKEGKTPQTTNRHIVQIHVPMVDEAVIEKIITIVMHPEIIRAKIAELREENKPVIDEADVTATIAEVNQQIANLLNLAQYATTQDMITRLGATMRDLEKQKEVAEAMLVVHEENAEERAELEKAINDFEAWCLRVQQDLNDPEFVPTYEHLRNAVRMLGIQVTAWPTIGEWPHRYKIDCTVPDVAEKMGSSIKIDCGTFSFSPRAGSQRSGRNASGSPQSSGS